MAKSYWSDIFCRTDSDKRAIKSWFSPLCDEMEPTRAEILCDIETDREKKLRAIFKNKDGKQFCAIRTNGRRYSITLKPTEPTLP